MGNRSVARQACPLFFALVALLPTRLFAGEPSPGMELETTERSPQEDLLVEHYINRATYQREVWLVPANQSSHRVLLYTHDRSVEVLFSPDERRLIVNDFFGSDIAAPHLFRRGRGFQYDEVKAAKITEKTWRFVGRRYPLVLQRDFGHRYVQVMRWASDSRAFLVAAFGHLDRARVRALDPYLCVFPLPKLRPSLNLSLMNRGLMHRVARHARHGGEATPSGPWR